MNKDLDNQARHDLLKQIRLKCHADHTEHSTELMRHMCSCRSMNTAIDAGVKNVADQS
jgi:hypothetical protein